MYLAKRNHVDSLTVVAIFKQRTYAYDPVHPHAVSSVDDGSASPSAYTYDANGNMVCRVGNGVTYKHDYNTDKVPAGGNRISAIHKVDGDCGTGTLVESWAFAGAFPEPERSEGTGTGSAEGPSRSTVCPA
jgi:YD repeat-containing protein